MSYLNKYCSLSPSPAELDCGGSNTQYFVSPVAGSVVKIGCLVSTVMVSTGAVVVTFYVRPTHGSSSGQTTIGTVTMGATATVGKVYAKLPTPITIAMGQEVFASVTTAASTSGKCIPIFEIAESPETDANNTSYVAG